MKIVNIVSVGSIDGILTTAALVRLCREGLAGFWGSPCVHWTQAFTVDRLRPEEWDQGAVALVDLGVNNRDRQMTLDFVRRLLAAGHRIVAVIDEHGADAWASVLAEAGIEMGSLCITPADRGSQIHSSGDILEAYLYDQSGQGLAPGVARPRISPQADRLCRFASASDLGQFGKTPYPDPELIVFPHWLANAVIKPAIQDDSRRDALVAYYSGANESVAALAKLLGWAAEYEQMQRRTAALLDLARDYHGVLRVDLSEEDGQVDMTALSVALQARADVVCVGRAGTYVLSSGSRHDLLTRIQSVIPDTMGMPNRVSVPSDSLDQAIATLGGS